jgi:hypothetical protein
MHMGKITRFSPSGLTVDEAVAAAAAGNIPATFVAHKFGKNDSLASGDAIMEPGGAYPYLTWTTAKAVRVKAGGNAADAAAGTGAQKIKVQGLDGNFNMAEAEITLNADGSLASAATTVTWSRVLRAFVSEAGSGRVNAGAVVLEWSDGSGDLATIIAGEGQSQLGFVTVPYGFRCLITHILLDTAVASASATVQIDGFVRNNANDVTTPFPAKRVFFEVQALSRENGSVERNFEEPLVFGEYTDIWFEGIPSGGTPIVSVAFSMVFERVRPESAFS